MNAPLSLAVLDLTTKQTQPWYVVEWREGKACYHEVFHGQERRDTWADERAKEGYKTIVYTVLVDARANRAEVAARVRENLRIEKYFPPNT